MNTLDKPKTSPEPLKDGPLSQTWELGYPIRLLGRNQTLASATRKISGIALDHPNSLVWWLAFLPASGLLLMLGVAIGYLLVKGVGIWGINIPVGWGFAIVNFVWWIGIGHAGTFISAILFLLNQKWRTSINRFTEAITIFAVSCAGLFPLLHLGRPWLFYWLIPYPDTMGVWPQFRSALVWDLFAVSTYFTVSLIFWYLGMIPDFASLRDQATTRFKQKTYAILALGWKGSLMEWERYRSLQLLLAGLATPLVLSVHSVVSFDFAIALVPGWHSTIFPPYFVAGAIYSGFAMVINIIIPVRAVYKLHDFITPRHLNNMGLVLLATGWMVTYGYIMEAFMAWYSGDIYERYMMFNRAFGPYGWIFWILMLINVVIPQALWSRRVRTSPFWLFMVGLSVNIGMWVERFVIVVTSLHRDFVPSSWRMYIPTLWDWLTLFGTVGLFLTLLLLFIRYLPVIAISEVRELIGKKEQTLI
ncbi:MAG: NrfD/PsrC family molybdoenzyme membrane anchor subunit [Verrucomicrobiota bacterium]